MSLLALLAAQGATTTPPPDPDPEPEGPMWSLGAPDGPVWVPEGALDRWLLARDNAANERVEVAFYGDSTSRGEFGSLPGPPQGDTTPPTAGYGTFPVVYRVREIAEADGYPSTAIGHYTRRTNTESPPYPLDYVGFVGGEGYDPIDRPGALMDGWWVDNPGDHVIWQGDGDKARIIYAHHGQLLGNFRYYVDGVLRGEVPYDTTWTGMDTYRSFEIDLGSPGRHQIKIEALGGVPTNPPTFNLGPVAGESSLTPGTYYYVMTLVPNTGGETAASLEKSVTIGPGQVARFNMSNQPPRTDRLRLYRATQPGGPYQFIKDTAASQATGWQWADDGTVTPTPGSPPATSTAGPSGWSIVDSNIEWVSTTGIVWHRYAISGAQSGAAVGVGAAYLMGLRTDNPPTHHVAPRHRLAINVYGTNDQQQTADRSTVLRDNLATWVDNARAVGADPVLCIPLYERANQKDTIDPGFTEKRSVRFRQIHRDVAIEKQCALIDLGSGGALAGTESAWGLTDPHLPAWMYERQAQYLWNELLKLGPGPT